MKQAMTAREFTERLAKAAATRSPVALAEQRAAFDLLGESVGVPGGALSFAFNLFGSVYAATPGERLACMSHAAADVGELVHGAAAKVFRRPT